MRLEVRTWDDRKRAWAAKAALRPDTPEERQALEAFAAFIGVELNGSRLEIVWSWDRVDRNRKKLAERRAARIPGTTVTTARRQTSAAGG